MDSNVVEARFSQLLEVLLLESPLIKTLPDGIVTDDVDAALHLLDLREGIDGNESGFLSSTQRNCERE